MKRRIRGRAIGSVVATALVIVSLAGCAVTPSATASGEGYMPYVPPVTADPVSLRSEFESNPQETHEFWSDPDMFENAVGIQYTSPDNGLSGGTSDPATGAFIPPTTFVPAAENPNGYGDVPNGATFDRKGLGGTALGRLYMQFDGGTGVCSASVVPSKSRSIVVTAAHCLADFENGMKPPKSVLFIPADRNNGKDAPLGKWAAVEMFVPQYFLDNAKVEASGNTSGSGWTRDHAFLVMEEKDGKRIQDVTGGMGIAFGVPTGSLTQVGYPTAAPYDGTDEFFCASTSWQQGWSAGYNHLCDMTPGSSGGAWMAYYNKDVGAGYIVAVNSTGNATRAEGSVLGQDALALYQKAEAVDP